MNTIKTQAIIGSLRSKADRSISVSFSTPELSTQEKALFFELQGIVVDLAITPREDATAETYVVDSDLKRKSQAQRIRSVLFLLWKQENPDQDFETFYKERTEKVIEWIKDKLDEKL